MKTFLLRLIGTAVLGAICAGMIALAYTTGIEVRSTSDANAVDENVAVGVEPQSSALPRKRSDIYYEAITERPLFASTRRPLVADAPVIEAEPVVAAAPVPQPDLPPSAVLFGLMGGTDMRQALVSVEGAPAEWLSIGDKLGTWTLTDAGTDWLEISSDKQKIRLELYQ